MIIVENIETPHGHVCVYGEEDFVGRMRHSIGNLVYEKFVFDKIDTLEFESFLDIGAAFGYYCHVLSAERKVDCTAIEADPWRVCCLYETTGDFARYGYTVGQPIVKPPLGKMASTFRPMQGMRTHCNTDTISFGEVLNFYANPREVLIKMDVEGAEFALIANNKHLINLGYQFIIEVHSKDQEDIELLQHFEGKTIECIHEGKCGVNRTYYIG